MYLWKPGIVMMPTLSSPRLSLWKTTVPQWRQSWHDDNFRLIVDFQNPQGDWLDIVTPCCGFEIKLLENTSGRVYYCLHGASKTVIYNRHWHYCDVTWRWWRLKSPAAPQLIKDNNKEYRSPSLLTLTQGQYCEKRFWIMMPSWTTWKHLDVYLLKRKCCHF